jgi:hypothetical protein
MKYLGIVIIVISIMTSCRSSKENCDAYGQIEKKSIEKDTHI